MGESSPAVAALLKETTTLPIVFVNVANPVGSGFVANLAHPGGTATGFTSNEPSMGGKWLQLLKEARPQIQRVNFMYNTYSASLFLSAFVQSFETAAQSLGVEAKQVTVRDAADIAPAMAEIARAPDQGVVIMADIFSTVHHAEYIAAASQYRIPAVYPFGFFAKNGGLIGFGASSHCFEARLAIAIGFFVARERLICLCKGRPNLNSSSISRPHRHLESSSRLLFYCARTT